MVYNVWLYSYMQCEKARNLGHKDILLFITGSRTSMYHRPSYTHHETKDWGHKTKDHGYKGQGHKAKDKVCHKAKD